MSRSIQNMFNGIAPKYDILNTILSFGIHHLWRRRTVKEANLNESSKVLDCATGTGDLAIALKNYYPKASIIGLDFSDKMLEIAKEKVIKMNLNLSLLAGDILHLPFPDNSFDAVTVSFGIRNVDNTLNGLIEMARVTKPGGKVIVLEFGQPSGVIKIFYNFYSRIFMPFVGRLFSGDRGAYKYLPATTLNYPCREKFIGIMNQTNLLENSYYHSLTGGISYLYVGIVKS